MNNRILICGLPNSGKTTFAKFLTEEYKNNEKPYSWLNGDAIRELYQDWDFSLEGRLRQTNRMFTIANDCKYRDVIIDYVCPLEEYRKIINPTHLIYIDTNDHTPYEDTKNLFEPVSNPIIIVKNKDNIYKQAKELYNQLKI